MAEIRTKAEFYDLYYKFALGNTIRQWEYDEFKRLYLAGSPELPETIAVRVKLPNNPFMRYHLSLKGALEYVEQLKHEHGIARELTQFSEHAPDHVVKLQGEICRPDYSNLYLRYDDRCVQVSGPNDPPCRIRYVLESNRVKHAIGLTAHLILKENMDGPSWDCLQELLQIYPDAVIEFAVYDKPVGVLGWNTITWEVRNY